MKPAGPCRLFTDGGARDNPGPAGIGAVLFGPDGSVLEEVSGYIGEATNNVAEYRGLIQGLEMSLARGVTDLDVFMDSVLVVQQMRGAFKVKHEGLKPLHSRARALAGQFDRITFQSVPREQNSHADRLMNEGIDRGEPPPPVQSDTLF